MQEALVGPNVVIGPDCKVEAGVRLRDAVLMKGARVQRNAFVKNSIVGWESTVGSWVCAVRYYSSFLACSQLHKILVS